MKTVISYCVGVWICLAQWPALAALDHVSIHSRQFDLGQHPQLTLNLVASKQALSRFGFFVVQSQSQEKLMVNTINDFKISIIGVEDVTEKDAQLVVREYQIDRWHDIAVLNMFAPAVPRTVAVLIGEPLLNSVEAAAPQSARQVAVLDECQLPEAMTLWRIASDYASAHKTHVYAAILAIFEANPSAFTGGKINHLRGDVSLKCPAPSLLAKYQNKPDAKAFFESLQ
ncbi:hypothetical protein [Shewanella sp. NIFS-20-20]|uniref:hypothetical protein n=1 Tax=Shewanella sp. NIFS-20-20 TaxID=2853806 RepID=UPI001C450FE2|nr:hypothetical protein [Shewanella sp. NIFS-20-20]MBV7316825.1 hypothetical protein [Shewanella sp. NIFS-20-20]